MIIARTVDQQCTHPVPRPVRRLGTAPQSARLGHQSASSLARASFKLNATQFHALSGDFNKLSSFITQNHLNQHHPTTTGDEIVQVEDGMSCGMAEISELHDWVDGLLTPALAEVKFSYRTTNELVSKILDVHLYLCDSLAKAASILSIYRSVLGHRLASSQPARPSQAEQPGLPLPTDRCLGCRR
ncbi:uncharacterized protein PGTG_17255 [Puccinia graminis f. sp. tritici CRL 75-36-700-3]|uniref:Uncharacterized protein n=1 Tax=Puccinia graminis f. sp. tritici (strain CRL 75-36-700-3 / race SCCL) TaxID=418459 RepID=E3L358_PUCGT|nr:uncharacterized protein PGTG_17255 [Puccinia graminis f. sp. tritici CRL 75-36-700-3]EFP90983.2 hypothetical protein PGTG_17255 [Puccinia graminis f. sp. tritici CRL 75-36-700-3]